MSENRGKILVFKDFGGRKDPEKRPNGQGVMKNPEHAAFSAPLGIAKTAAH